LCLVLLVACYDEFRQSLSLERTGAGTDVALDFSGGLIALLLSWLYMLAHRRWFPAFYPASNKQESPPT
jgi:hypothetical protein